MLSDCYNFCIKFQHTDILCRCTEFGCGDYVDSGLDGTIIKMYTHRPCKIKGFRTDRVNKDSFSTDPVNII